MSRRIDIELTSARDDGTWTWRAAGARQPKGVLDGSVLYEGARTGDVVRAEADFEIDGITILSVIPPKEKRSEPARLEIVGPPREVAPVTSSLVSRRERPDRDSGRRGPRTDDRTGRPGRPPRERSERPAERGERTGRPRGEGAGRESSERAGRPESRGPRAPRPAPEPKPRERRLNPGNAHRTAAMEALSPEQRPIAEQVLRGGIPAVRTALEQEDAKAKEEGRPEVNRVAILAMAEELLPKMKAAEWHDRAEAAAKAVDDVSLRDLRAVVAGADAAARDDETRALASTLREALERRVTAQRDEWTAEITKCLDENRLVRALRVAARPPDPGSRFPSDLATRLSDAASAAMSPDVTPERWATLLDAVAGSPVRRSVKPVGLPAEPGDELLKAARQQSGRVPALAAMLGIDMPPPPGPPPGARPHQPRSGRPPRPGSGPGGNAPRGSSPSQSPRPVPPAPAAPAPQPAESQAATQTPEPAAIEAPAPTPEPAAIEAAAPTPELAPIKPTAELAPVEAVAPTAEPEAVAHEPTPVAQTTEGAHDVPSEAEPTSVGALASPDPAEEARAESGQTDAAPPLLLEPDSPAEAVAAQLLREQAGDEGQPADAD